MTTETARKAGRILERIDSLQEEIKAVKDASLRIMVGTRDFSHMVSDAKKTILDDLKSEKTKQETKLAAL